MKNDVVAIMHTYAQDRELGSYMNALKEAFVNVGVTLHLIIANDLVYTLAANKFKSSISEKKIIDFINGLSPAFVFTTNRAGVSKKMMAEIHCPLLTWMVDRIPFLHHGGTHEDLFCDKDYVITSSFKNVERLEEIYPVLKNKVSFLPFATNIRDFQRYSGVKQCVQVSFVGTYFYSDQFSEILNFYKGSPEMEWGLLELAKRVEEDYDLNFELHLNDCGVAKVLQEFSLDVYKFKGLITNTISLNRRIKNLDVLTDLGLELYGTSNWFNVNQFSLSLLRCYKHGVFIKTRAQLVKLYQRSKIAVNVSHHQAVDGLPYRIYDIMASDALLITEYRENSDLFRLFGDDMPVPMYKTPQELRSLCEYYLTHEEERIQVVSKCQKLVQAGFGFEDRVYDFFKILQIPEPSGKGGLAYIDVKKIFETPHGRVWRMLHSFYVGRMVIRIFNKVVSRCLILVVQIASEDRLDALGKRVPLCFRGWLKGLMK